MTNLIEGFKKHLNRSQNVKQFPNLDGLIRFTSTNAGNFIKDRSENP